MPAGGWYVKPARGREAAMEARAEEVHAIRQKRNSAWGWQLKCRRRGSAIIPLPGRLPGFGQRVFDGFLQALDPRELPGRAQTAGFADLVEVAIKLELVAVGVR